MESFPFLSPNLSGSNEPCKHLHLSLMHIHALQTRMGRDDEETGLEIHNGTYPCVNHTEVVFLVEHHESFPGAARFAVRTIVLGSEAVHQGQRPLVFIEFPVLQRRETVDDTYFLHPHCFRVLDCFAQVLQKTTTSNNKQRLSDVCSSYFIRR